VSPALVSSVLCFALASQPGFGTEVEEIPLTAEEQAVAEEWEAVERAREQERLDGLVQERNRKRAVGGVLVGLGAVAFIVGVVMAVAGGADPAIDTGPDCSIGKPCGNTCIEWADTCSIPSTPSSGSRDEGNLGVSITGLVLATGSAVPIVLGAVQLVQARNIVIAATPSGLVVRF
jgi:hypothetical protein